MTDTVVNETDNKMAWISVTRDDKNKILTMSV